MEDSLEPARDHATVEYGELPELTRGLRALGSSRSGRGGSMQSQFFHPLIDARRRAADAKSAGARVNAFDAPELLKSLERFIDRVISEWPDKRESVRRALRAELRDRASPYVTALARLAERSVELGKADDPAQLAAWRGWTSQLAATFQAADITWMGLRSAVESLPAKK